MDMVHNKRARDEDRDARQQVTEYKIASAMESASCHSLCTRALDGFVPELMADDRPKTRWPARWVTTPTTGEERGPGSPLTTHLVPPPFTGGPVRPPGEGRHACTTLLVIIPSLFLFFFFFLLLTDMIIALCRFAVPQSGSKINGVEEQGVNTRRAATEKSGWKGRSEAGPGFPGCQACGAFHVFCPECCRRCFFRAFF